jgi:hypothetical protein
MQKKRHKNLHWQKKMHEIYAGKNARRYARIYTKIYARKYEARKYDKYDEVLSLHFF